MNVKRKDLKLLDDQLWSGVVGMGVSLPTVWPQDSESAVAFHVGIYLSYCRASLKG